MRIAKSIFFICVGFLLNGCMHEGLDVDQFVDYEIYYKDSVGFYYADYLVIADEGNMLEVEYPSKSDFPVCLYEEFGNDVISVCRQDPYGDSILVIRPDADYVLLEGSEGIDDYRYIARTLFSPPGVQLHYPIDNFETGITLKPFGKYITPETSPVQPEIFSGYHVGVDIEVEEENLDEDVWVYAITNCVIKESTTLRGYGGVVVLGCEINGKDYVLLYGHVANYLMEKEVGEIVEFGEKLTILGEQYSIQTDGERKHLHFSIKEGTVIDYAGYVQSELGIQNWIDPVEFYNNRIF